MATPSDWEFPAFGSVRELIDSCNRDKDFTSWAKHLVCRLVLRADTVTVCLAISKSQILSVSCNINEIARGDITISGRDSDWVRAVRDSHASLHRAWRHQTLSFDGDLEKYIHNYKAFWRLGSLMHNMSLGHGFHSKGVSDGIH